MKIGNKIDMTIEIKGEEKIKRPVKSFLFRINKKKDWKKAKIFNFRKCSY